MSLFASFDAFRWVCAFFYLVTKLAQANKMNVCVFAPRWKGSKELWWKLELARRYTHSCEQRIQYNIHARHSTSTHTNLFIASVEPSPYQCTMASHLSLKSIYIIIWFDCLFSNFYKKILIEFVWRERIQCTSISFNVARAIVWQFTWYFRQSSLSTFPIKILCQPLSISM